MTATEFEGPPGTLSHHEGELVDGEPEPDAQPAEDIDGPDRPEGEPAEHDEQEGDDEPADPADAAPPADGTAAQLGMTAEALEEMMVKLTNSAKTWRKRVRELLGENADALVACELCEADIPGFHWPAELVQPESELHERLLTVLLTSDGPEYSEATTVHVCPDCQGWGKVKTGSKVGGKTLIDCPTCRRYGYVPPPSAQAERPAGAETVEPAAEPEPGMDASTDNDVWGSPKYLPDGSENPNWGRMVQYKDPDLP